MEKVSNVALVVFLKVHGGSTVTPWCIRRSTNEFSLELVVIDLGPRKFTFFSNGFTSDIGIFLFPSATTASRAMEIAITEN